MGQTMVVVDAASLLCFEKKNRSFEDFVVESKHYQDVPVSFIVHFLV